MWTEVCRKGGNRGVQEFNLDLGGGGLLTRPLGIPDILHSTEPAPAHIILHSTDEAIGGKAKERRFTSAVRETVNSITGPHSSGRIRAGRSELSAL